MILSLAFMLVLAQDQERAGFPHGEHRGLFAGCLTCHAGVAAGDSAQARPAAAGCTACHDGSIERRVAWQPRGPRATNLRFDHRAHARDTTLTCTACHASRPGAAFMDAGPARPDVCLSCHEPRAPSHFEARDCATCHQSLRAATRLALRDLASLPRPPSHEGNYIFRHGADVAERPTTCAFCHTRESCASCHVNAGRVPAIASLGEDARMAALASMRPARDYPRPASHARLDFLQSHGPMANASGATCAACHARESCVGCHRSGERAPAIAALPSRGAGAAHGVVLAMTRPPDHLPGFSRRHDAAASAGGRGCQACHAPVFCASCHDGSGRPDFHAPNFAVRHGAEAFTQTSECATCHQPQAFCQSCHRETGRSTTPAQAGRYHDAQPRWAFAHGAAARRSIETCASCHRQSDCMQCHSATRGQGVSPHGPRFDPSIASRNPGLCARCHGFGIPRR